jgi:MFS family permease
MWMLFLALAYATQGFAQTTGILFQPIQYFYKAGHGYSASQLAAITFWITFPWYIKPVYGLFADFIPLWGYRRRSYILVSAFIAFFAFTLLLGIDDPILLIYALTLTALCTAVGDVMVDALMVEHGQHFNKVKEYQSVQWMAISVLGILAAIGGGAIAQHAKANDDPHLGVQIGAIIAASGPLILLAATFWIVREPKSKLNKEGIARSAVGLREALKSKALLGVILFVCAFWFQPGTSASMYLHATETLPISEQQYGNSDAYAKGGYLLGTLVFMLVLARSMTTRQLATLSVFLYAGITFAYLALVGPKSLYALGFGYGFCYMICNLTLLSLAAEVCPKRVEGFVFAFLMGLMNFVRLGSDWVGGKIYDELIPVYAGETTEGFWTNLAGMKYPIDPLLAISGVVTLLALVFIPLLPKQTKSEKQPAVE